MAAMEVKPINGGSPVIECDRCGRTIRKSGNVYFCYVTKTGKIKWHKPRFICQECSPQQYKEDQAKGLVHGSFGLGEFLDMLVCNAETKNPKRPVKTYSRHQLEVKI
jgi:hypothetical protein